MNEPRFTRATPATLVLCIDHDVTEHLVLHVGLGDSATGENHNSNPSDSDVEPSYARAGIHVMFARQKVQPF